MCAAGARLLAVACPWLCRPEGSPAEGQQMREAGAAATISLNVLCAMDAMHACRRMLDRGQLREAGEHS